MKNEKLEAEAAEAETDRGFGLVNSAGVNQNFIKI